MPDPNVSFKIDSKLNKIIFIDLNCKSDVINPSSKRFNQTRDKNKLIGLIVIKENKFYNVSLESVLSVLKSIKCISTHPCSFTNSGLF